MKKVALIFGASSTIGGCISKELSQEYETINTYFHTPIPNAFKVDIRDFDQIDYLIKNLPRLDVLVLSSFPFIEADPFDFNSYSQTESIHTGHMRAICDAAPLLMKNNGRIVNILGQCVRNGLPAAPHYSAFFAAMHNFGKSVNGTYGKSKKISVVDVLLAAVDTREWNGISPEIKKRYEEKMSQFISPSEVAKRVAFELSCEVMATELVIDGYVLV
ncbi:MAG TPA: SDR family NAD(P)-dependent oxidoreductase [Spirochaetia bacterium]|nr:SDR family NAD(P)-dependent oxidoreductase [Spirochaetia bacterium]